MTDEEIKGLLRMNNNFLVKIMEILEKIENKLEVIKNGIQLGKLAVGHGH